MRRGIRLWKLACCMFLIGSSFSLLAQTKPEIKNFKSAPFTDQEVLLLLAGESSSHRILLMLNNNRADELTTDLTLYSIDGTVIPLPSVKLKRSESRLIELGRSLQEANINERLGFLKLHYSGRILELGAQLTLYPSDFHGGIDSPRSIKADFVSSARSAVAWLPPESKATIAFTNTGESPRSIRFHSGHREKALVVNPLQTIIQTEQDDLAGQSRRETRLDVDISYDGPKDTLRVFGYVTSTRYGTYPIRVYDPQSATMKTLSAVGLETARPNHVMIRNLTDVPQTIVPDLTEVGSQTPATKSLSALLIGARSSKALDLNAALDEFKGKGVDRVTLRIENNAPVGAFVGSVTEELEQGVLEDIPFRTSNPLGFMRGAYPLRWERDYTNRPMVANTGNEEAKVRAYVIAGGVTYTFPITTVKAGATIDYDIDKIRSQQIPDISGKTTIPLTAKFGKFHWAPAVGEIKLGLHGRTELKSISDRRASSFSCGMMCDYEWEMYPYFDVDPFGNFPSPYTTGSKQSQATMYVIDAYGNPSGNYPVYVAQYAPVSPGDTSILTNAEEADHVTLRSDTNNPGTTNVTYHFTEFEGIMDEEGSFCSYLDQGYDPQPVAAVQVPTSARVVNSTYYGANSCPSGQAGFRRSTVRAIVDQFGVDIKQANQALTENVVINSSGLGTGPITTSPGNTDNTGQFFDEFRFCSSACPASSNTMNLTQTITDTYNGAWVLNPTSLEYACSSIKIDGRVTP